MSHVEQASDPKEDGRNAGVLTSVSNALVALHKEQFGRGPVRARTAFADDDTLICTMRDALLPAEQALVEMGHHERVQESRLFFQMATRHKFIDAVEELIGRKVAAFSSATDPHAAIVWEVFTLEPKTDARRSDRPRFKGHLTPRGEHVAARARTRRPLHGRHCGDQLPMPAAATATAADPSTELALARTSRSQIRSSASRHGSLPPSTVSARWKCRSASTESLASDSDRRSSSAPGVARPSLTYRAARPAPSASSSARDPQRVAEPAGVDLDDAHAAGVVGHQQPLALEPPQRLAQRGAADLQPLGDLQLHHPPPRSDLAAQDRRADELRDARDPAHAAPRRRRRAPLSSAARRARARSRARRARPRPRAGTP